MSHCSKQLRDWIKTNLTGISGLATPVTGTPRQLAAASEHCLIKSVDESTTTATLNDPPIEERTHTIEVVLISNTFDGVDAMSVLVEETLQSATNFPGKTLALVSRAYEEDKSTDRDYVALTLSFTATYFVDADDVELFA